MNDVANIRRLHAELKDLSREEREARASLRDAKAERNRQRTRLTRLARELRAADPHHPLLAECDAALDVETPRVEPKIPPLPPRTLARDRWIYFAQAVTGGAIKIGVTGDVAERLRSLQCGSPVELRVIAVAAGSVDDETRLHRQLAKHRLHGEWFADTDDVRAAIAEITR